MGWMQEKEKGIKNGDKVPGLNNWESGDGTE